MDIAREGIKCLNGLPWEGREVSIMGASEL